MIINKSLLCGTVLLYCIVLYIVLCGTAVLTLTTFHQAFPFFFLLCLHCVSVMRMNCVFFLWFLQIFK